MAIRKTTKENVTYLTKKDVVLVWRGTNNIGKNEAANGLIQLKYFVRENSHSNVIQICATQVWFICEFLCRK
jgi:hypothetical protein